MKYILLNIFITLSFAAATYEIASHGYQIDQVKMERQLRTQERKLARLSDKYQTARDKLDQRALSIGDSAVSFAAFEARKLNAPMQQPIHDESSIIQNLEAQLKEMTVALEESQKRVMKPREKRPSVRIHYYRPDKEYYGWGVHADGEAVLARTAWNEPVDFRYIDDFGAYAKVKLHENYKTSPLKMLVHNGPELDCDPDPDTSYTSNDKVMLSGDAYKHKDWYLVSGIDKIFFDKAEALAAKSELAESQLAAR